jgi:hypothetical protein
MTQHTFDRFDITVYLTENIHTLLQLTDVFENKIQKAFREKYGIKMGFLQEMANAIDQDTIYVGQPERQNIIVWNGYAVFNPADTRKFGFLRIFRARQRLSAKLKDTLMESLEDYYIDSKVSYE